MNYEIQFWVTSGVLSFLVAVLLLAGRMIASGLGQKIDSLVKITQEQNRLMAILNEQIKSLFNTKEETTKRLNDHSERIRELEKIQASCRNFKTN